VGWGDAGQFFVRMKCVEVEGQRGQVVREMQSLTLMMRMRVEVWLVLVILEGKEIGMIGRLKEKGRIETEIIWNCSWG
jgi:hypothetical protein